MAIILYEIPIYYCSKDKWTKKAEQNINKFIAKMDSITENVDSPNSLKGLREFSSRDEMIWLYNGIIGYLRIYSDIGFIFTDIYLIRNKRIDIFKKNKIFNRTGRITKFEIDSKMQSEDISNILKDIIQKAKKHKNFRDRFIELSQFSATVDNTDWKNVIFAPSGIPS
jgi:hypothetical protein